MNIATSSDAHLLKAVPTLMVYIQRVGATQKSFRRYVINDGPAYGASNRIRKDRATIHIERDGTIFCQGDVEPPTEAEVAAIKSELATARWPTSGGAPKNSLPNELKDKDPENIFVFRSRDGQQILFIQHRVETAEGKYYSPWSYWSDQKWRNMEPDGLLPLFGLDRLGDHTTVFIHEGAKAARHCQWMTEARTLDARTARDKHPWAKELGGAAHLGWAGGAPSPHRTDWGVLRRAGVKRVYVVADNDHVGEEAVSKISKLTQLQMAAIKFDDRFKEGFDLGDAWPDAKGQPEWWNADRYLGPGFHDMCVPATWATYKIQTGEKGRPKYGLRDAFVKEWALSKLPHLFAHREYAHLLMTPEVFNRTVAPFSDVEDVAALLAKHFPVHADSIAYRPHAPGAAERIITIDGRRLINTYRSSAIQPVPGDVSKFLELMEYLIPDPEDRHKVMRWCATLIARPQIRMRYSLLLISETQGVGKTTLSDAILKPLVGPWNVSSPTEQQVTDSNFNGWIAHRRLANVNEIYSGERRKCYDRLKQVTADSAVDVERKFMEPYSIECFLHVVACSNSMLALHLDDTDRRFLVPGVTEHLKPKEWWEEFYSWLNGGGLSAIAAWAEDYVRQHKPVATSDRAPDTTRKQEIIAATRSEGAQLAFDLGRMVSEAGKFVGPPARDKPRSEVVLRLDQVREWVARMRGMDVGDRRMESPLTLRKALIAAGLMRPKKKEGASEFRVSIGGRPTEILANYQIEAGEAWGSKVSGEGLAVFHRLPEHFIPVPM